MSSETRNHERELAARFLALPFRKQIFIANNLGVLNDEGLSCNDEELFRITFKRSGEKGLLWKLWSEVNQFQDNPEDFNPFQMRKGQTLLLVFLSSSGHFASMREVRNLINSGAVKVNDEIVTNRFHILSPSNTVTVGKKLFLEVKGDNHHE